MYVARIIKRDRRCVTGYRTVHKRFENFDAAVRWARANHPDKLYIHEGLNAFIPDNIIYEEVN